MDLRAISLTTVVASSCAWAQERIWVAQPSSLYMDHGRWNAPHPDGGIYAGGITEGNIGAPNPSGVDLWFARYSAAGHRLWVRQLGGSLSSSAILTCMAAEAGGSGVFIGGWGGPLFGAGSFGAWVAKYDENGQYAWHRSYQAGVPTITTAVAPTPDGGCIIGGYTAGSLGGPNLGLEDFYLIRCDAQGNQIWARQLGTAGWDYVDGIVADGDGGVYLGGRTTGDIGPGEGNVYVAHVNGQGTLEWVHQFADCCPSDWVAIARTGGYLVLAGKTPQSPLVSWVARFEVDGTPRWFNQNPSGSPDDRALWVAPDGDGGAYVSGTCAGPGGTAAYIARYDEFGESLGTQTIGGSVTQPSSMSVTRPGEFYVVGTTSQPLGPIPSGQWDAFVARFGRCYPNCDWSTSEPMLNVADFTCFLQHFASGALYANCDGSTTASFLNVADFTCFLQRFAAGCE